MSRIVKSFRVEQPDNFKKRMLNWAQSHQEIVFLDSNNHDNKYSSFNAVLAANSVSCLKTNATNSFERLSKYKNETKDWIFGYLSYDLKNELEDLTSSNFDGLGFYSLHFFQPQKLIFLKGNLAEFQYLNCNQETISTDFKEICETQLKNNPITIFEKPKISLRIHKDAYLNKICQVLKRIQKGAIYEVNICQEFYAEETRIDPLSTYEKLNSISKAPFSTYLKLDNNYALCASPERFLKKKNTKLIAQPIKGTAARSSNAMEDSMFKAGLANDPKELSENIMITDLVRNDLSKNALKGSVKVEELCKVYSFKQVHQMISTVSAQTEADPIDLIKDSFPMGSMTGAPKVSAMKIIEEFEETKRGLYSGAVGYFDESHNFDFNVIIRSILYNSKKKFVSYSVGSAITAQSNPQNEYQECLLKAKAMRSVLEQK